MNVSSGRRVESSATSYLPGKKGIGLVSGRAVLQALQPSWSYNWGPIRPSWQPDNVEFVPMIWGGASLDTSLLQEKIETYIQPDINDGKIRRLLGFNEPDSEDQSNMEIDSAIALWDYIANNVNLPLVSPSCVHADGDWMQEFMANDDVSEWVGVHWYGSADSTTFQSDMESYYERYQKPLLITEFAPADWSATSSSGNQISTAKVLQFMKNVLPWLEQQDWIAGYAWFPFKMNNAAGTSSALFDHSSGDLTDCGRFYASVNSSHPYGDQSIGITTNSYYYATSSFLALGFFLLVAANSRRRLRQADAALQQELVASSCDANI